MNKTKYPNAYGARGRSDDFDYEADEAEEAEDAEDAEEADDLDASSTSYEETEDEVQPVGLFSTPARTVSFGISVFILLVVAIGVAWLLGQRAAGSTPNVYRATSADSVPGAEYETAVKVGAVAPDFQLNDVYTGNPVKLSSYKGKPVWVNFWASWCPPCKAEMPEMKQRYDKYKDKGLVILGVDDAEDAATVKQFTKLNGYNWTFMVDSGDVVGRYFVSGLPTHVFVDKAGIIRAMQVGGISGNVMDDALAKIIGQ